jgi:WD40 repeat protein
MFVDYTPDSEISVAHFPDTSSELESEVWSLSVADGSLTKKLDAHTRMIWNTALSPDGRILATASGDDTARLWQVADGTLLQTMRAAGKWVCCVAFSYYGAMLDTVSDGKFQH